MAKPAKGAILLLLLAASGLSGCMTDDTDDGVEAPTNPVTYPPLVSSSLSSSPPVPVGPNGTIPPAWNTSLDLLPYQMFSAHSGFFRANLAPNGTLARPASCIAYRNESRYDVDTCFLRDANSSREPNATWIAEASWAENARVMSEGHGQPHRVVAFDADGTNIAFWDGRRGPYTSYVTE